MASGRGLMHRVPRCLTQCQCEEARAQAAERQDVAGRTVTLPQGLTLPCLSPTNAEGIKLWKGQAVPTQQQSPHRQHHRVKTRGSGLEGLHRS